MHFSLFTFHFSLFLCHAQTATITGASVQGKTVVVTYDIADAKQGQTFDIELWYNANAAGFKKCSSLNSSEGLTELTAGYGKQISWNVLQDLQRLEANTLDFEIRASVKAKNTFAINTDFIVEGIAMRGIQGGTFTMGSNDGGSDEKPTHQVIVGNFAMMKTELTVAQFKVFIDETGYQTDADKRTGGYGSYCWNGSSWEQKDSVNWKCGVSGSRRPQSEYNHPVIHVSWNDAVAYAEWFSHKTGQIWRLPTEAEWEYAARGGQNFKYAGSNNLDDVAWYNGNSGNKTHPAGQKTPNGFGLYDLSGNVWEWCNDWYGNYRTGSQTNPRGPSAGVVHVFRGGSWYYDMQNCRTADRVKSSTGDGSPEVRSDLIGFRFVFPK